jgi:cytidylate kinase
LPIFKLMKISTLDQLNRYLAAHAAIHDTVRQPTPLSITISREAGAGGSAIAHLLSARLAGAESASISKPWVVFDANLAKQVLEDHKLPLQLEAFITEEAKLPIEDVVEELLGLHPSHWTLVQHTTKTILKLASLGHAIIVGRGSAVITARFPSVLHVRLVAPFKARLRYIGEHNHISTSEAEKILREQDDSRRRYLRTYFHADIDDPVLYDLTINTGRLGFTRCADLIHHLAREHEEMLHSG